MKKVVLFGCFILWVTVITMAQTKPGGVMTKDDAIFTTYAADMARSAYRWDQAYHFQFYKQHQPLAFVSDQGGSLGLAFKKDDKLRIEPDQMYSEPVITASYHDVVKYTFYPYKDVKVECTFLVYSSSTALQVVKITNEGLSLQQFDFNPYFFLDQGLSDVQISSTQKISFTSTKTRDNWMKEHAIPLSETLANVFSVNRAHGKAFTYKNLDGFMNSIAESTSISGSKKVIGFTLPMSLGPGDAEEIRIVRSSAPLTQKLAVRSQLNKVNDLNLHDFIDERALDYSQVPPLVSTNADYQNLYHSAFCLIRQCVMPPEAKSSYNYYVFSREPKWGWGYGGQVFHESLVMLAYAYMDPLSAMNSQRVFIERQWPSGYINYRTGPYLDEQIEYNKQFTSSAPWFNYQNYEVYKVSHDTTFLHEAYVSGKAFYTYYVSNRDANNNGLAEWGAHAELESVRDARVAVWDRVGWPGNFESPDLNAMLVMEAKALAAMARELGLKTEAKDWQQQAKTRTDLINKYLWDEKSGFYYNADTTDLDFSFKTPDDLKVMEIIGFVPLWAGVASKEQAAKLVENLTDPEKFWRRFGIPSLSAEDDYYNPIGYWNGPVWVQWQYLIFRGLIDYGYDDLALKLAEKVLDNVVYHLKKDHTFWEFYSADDYQAGWNKTYIWTGITARFLIDMQVLTTKKTNASK